VRRLARNAIIVALLAAPALADELRLERITTAVPWPRGVAVLDDGRVVVLARGRPRRSGGVDPSCVDRAGTLFVVDPDVAEPVVPGAPPGARVAANARALATASAPPFHVYEGRVPPREDTRMDRPYCTLAWDPTSRNLFVCAFSGVDLPDGSFRKNATDALFRYDLRAERWAVVEQHRAEVVAAGELSHVAPNDRYPHHDATTAPAPHGWLNGPDGCAVAGEFLYAVAKDNSTLAQYDLADIRRDPGAGPPSSRVALGDAVDVDGRSVHVEGHSAVVARDGWLYVGFRTTSQVIRLPLDARGDLVRPLAAQVVARFAPWDGRVSDDLIDLAFDPEGALYVATARQGRVWRVGAPDPARPFVSAEQAPWLDLRARAGVATVGNIAFDAQGRLYVCGGAYDAPGALYRASRP
jgi:hypothetical protein